MRSINDRPSSIPAERPTRFQTYALTVACVVGLVGGLGVYELMQLRWIARTALQQHAIVLRQQAIAAQEQTMRIPAPPPMDAFKLEERPLQELPIREQ